MKCFIQCFVIALAMEKTIWAQGLIGLYPDGPSQFNINFAAVGNAPIDRLPFSSVSTNSLGYSSIGGALTNIFTIAIIVGATSPNTGGQILRMENDGSLTPINQFSIHLAPKYGYFDTLSMDITDAQVQNLLSGKWYARIDFGTDSYIGQLSQVPEPSGIALIILGIGVMGNTRNLLLKVKQSNRPVAFKD